MLKIVWKLVAGVVIGAAVLASGLIVSIAGDGLGAAQRLAAVSNVTIPNAAGPTVKAYVARPAGAGPYPVVIMLHEFYGLTASIKAKADWLAAEGYLVVAPDLFRGSTTDYIPRAIYHVISTPAEQVNGDLDAVLAWAAAQPEARPDQIVVAGFCFGGRSALLYSLHNPQVAGTVVFYGGPVTDAERLKSLPGPVLGIFGGADSSIPLEDVRAFETGLTAAGIPHQISIYDGQPHAFVTSVDAIRQGGVQGQAWAEMLDFLAATFSAPASPARVVPAQADDFFGWAALARLAWAHTLPDHH